MWTIICHRNISSNRCDVRYGRYHNGIITSTHDQFQDRSPRPSLSFHQFQKPEEEPKLEKKFLKDKFWERYADCAINRVLDPVNYSWQDDLVKEIIKKVLENPERFKKIK